jgi:hypothetical protein
MEAAMTMRITRDVTENCNRKRDRQAGFSLLETVVATGLLCAVAFGIMALAVVALMTSENQGHLVARTSEYSQDKMEQLLALAFNDTSSNTTVIPTVSTGGVGLTIGGSSTPSSPSTGYVDYLDSSGNILTTTGNTAPSGWQYIRVWSIAAGPAGATNEKLITVTTEVETQVGSYGALPESTVSVLKVNPF